MSVVAPRTQEQLPDIKEILESGPYQTTLPDGLPTLSLPRGGGGFPVEVFFILLGVVVILFLISLLTSPARPARRVEDEEKAVPATTSSGPDPDQPLPDPAALASQGRFAEAVHVLLLEALLALAETGRTWKPSWTSRQILRRERLPEPIREPLQGLVGTVERTTFGPDPATRDDYERSRDDYESLCRELPGMAS